MGSESLLTVVLHSYTLPFIVNFLLSSLACWLSFKTIPKVGHMFIKAGLFGRDLGKRCDESGNKPILPEAIGVVIGAIYLIATFLFIPIPFLKYFAMSFDGFPHEEFVAFVAALLSICCMIFLGFADDVLELRWRDKLLLPMIASLPLLMVYSISYNHTHIMVPLPFRHIVGDVVNLGILYYVYMGMMAVFCTNAINILAGINGLEVGQSIVIAVSVVIFNITQIVFGGAPNESHEFSLYLLVPYISVTLPLYYYNRYPAQVFVGDTFCYFSGMTFAVVAICGHFSKTMLLFFLPQIINFLYSAPQLFRFVPCPRHRLPRFDPDENVMHMSTVRFKRSSLGVGGRLILGLFRSVGMLSEKVTHDEAGVEWAVVNNLTIINLALKLGGPRSESSLNSLLMVCQVCGSIVAFFIRYQMAKLFYPGG